MTDVDTRQHDSEFRQRGGKQQGGEKLEHAKEQLKSKAKEYQPQAEQLLRKGEQLSKDAYDKVCETCQNLKQYPKLTTGLLLLSAFCLGIAVTAAAGRMGYFVPSTGHFTRDKTAIEAHAALDTLLRNMHSAKGKLNTKYKDTADSLHLARETLINVMAAKMGSWSDTADHLKDKAGELKDKAGELKDRAYEKLHDSAGNLKDKLHDAADTIKNLGHKPEPTMADKIRDAIHDARDAVNEQYYNVKGKVLGKEKEIEESKIKSTLHEAENKIKDMLHMQ